MTNHITLSQAVKDLYFTNPQYSVKEMMNLIHGQHQHLQEKAHYRAIYNTLKRVSGKPTQPSQTQKASVILDLSQAPINKSAVKGKVYFAGKKSA